MIWILDAAWGWSAAVGGPPASASTEAIAPSVVLHGVAGAFTLGVPVPGRPADRQVRCGRGRAPSFKPHNLHLTLMGLMLIFTGFYGFYAACLVITSTLLPGWLNIYLFPPTTLGPIFFAITVGFAGGFTGGFFASKGEPFWTLSGGLAGACTTVSAGADVYAPLARLPAGDVRWRNRGVRR